MTNGPLAGFPVDSLKVTCLMVHSMQLTPISYHLRYVPARHSAMQHQKRVPSCLEPIMKLEIVTPDEYMGEIIGDLNRRRGDVTGYDDQRQCKGYTC
jgi:elongation factor G